MNPADEHQPTFPMSGHADTRKDGGTSQPEWQPSQEEWWDHRRDLKDLKEIVKGKEEQPGLVQRVAAIERWQTLVIGITAGVSAVIGYALSFLRGEK